MEIAAKKITVKTQGVTVLGDIEAVADFLFVNNIEQFQCRNVNYEADAANSLEDEVGRLMRNNNA